MRGYRPPPAPPVVMADIPPVSGVADLEARLHARSSGRSILPGGPQMIGAGFQPEAITLSQCEGALRSVEAGRLSDVKPRLIDCLGAAGCLAIGPRETILTAAGIAILAEIDRRRGAR